MHTLGMRPGSGRSLRVGLIGVRVQEARRYYVSLQTVPGSGLSSQAAGFGNGVLAPDQVVRTETSEVSRNPEFAACSFVLWLPQPLGVAADGGPLLRVDLYAAPTLESAGPVPGGAQPLDELVGSGLVACAGDMAARLLRGERVAATATLGDTPPAAGGDNGAGGSSVMLPLGASSASVGLRGGPGRSREVLLELMLLDAQLALPSDAFAARTMASGAGLGSLAALPSSPSGGSRRECSLLVLVSRAENLPLVMGEGGVEVEPDTFVAAKSLRDASGSTAAQALTRVAPRSRQPAWQQVLRVRYPVAELPTEQLLLAVVNNANNRLMMKAALPLAPLVPGKHYNLRLTLPGGPLGSAVHLYVTLVLTDCATAQQRYLRNRMAAAKQLLQARLASASRPLNFPESAGDATGAASSGQLFGVWSVAGEAAAGEAPRLPESDPYTTLDASNEAGVAAALHAMADRHAAAMKAGVDAGGSCAEVLPIQADAGDQRLWPPDHMVSLLSAASSNAALQLALYQVPSAATLVAAPAATASAPAAAPLSQAERLLGPPAGEPGSAAAAGPSEAAAEAAGDAAGAGAGPEPRSSARLLGWVAVPLQARATDGLGPGQVQLLEGLEVKPGPRAPETAAAPGTAAASSNPVALTVSLELRQRDTAAVVATLESEASQQVAEESAHGLAASQSGDRKTAVAWQAGATASGLGLGGGGEGSGGTAAGAVVEALVDTCIQMQGALGRLIRQLDAAAAQAEVSAWRVADAENRCRSASADNDKLRQLLHEEKQACRSPPLLMDASSLSRDDLIIRCEAAMAGFGRERRRNAELVHRLQQLHAEQVDTIELKKRYQQLQEAHMEQARAYVEIEKEGRRNGQLQATLKTQEEIIRNLEAVLAQAVEKAKLEGAAERRLRAEHEKLLAAAQQLEEQCKAQDARIPELESQLAAAQQQLAAQEAELEVLRQHTTTEFRADGTTGEPTRGGGPNADGGGEPGPDYQRVKQLEELLAAARERCKELEAGVSAKQAAEDNLKRLETDVSKVVEEKTAAVLRAEYAEGAASAAQEELIAVTKKFARDIAELKTRLAEKDAMLMGGFGDLDQLRRGELSQPTDLGGFDPSRLGTPPGMAPMPGHMPPPAPFVRRASAGASAGGQGFGLGHGPGLGPPGPGFGQAPAARVRSAEAHERSGRGSTPPASGTGASPGAAARPASQGASPSQPLLPPINPPHGGGPEASGSSPPEQAKPARTRLSRRPQESPPVPPPREEPPPQGAGGPPGKAEPTASEDGQEEQEGGGRRARWARRRK